MFYMENNSPFHGFIWVCDFRKWDFKMCDLKKIIIIFKNAVKGLVKSQFGL
jgi:hypothetical protein